MTDAGNAPYIDAVQKLMRCPAIYEHLGDVMYVTRLFNRQARYGELTQFRDDEREQIDMLVEKYLEKEQPDAHRSG